MVGHAYNSSYSGGRDTEDQGPGQAGNKAKPHLKNDQCRAAGMAHMLEHLSRK
jgi:hypothetical protein